MLAGSHFSEGKELAENGFVQIRLSGPEDDPTAMMMILGCLYKHDGLIAPKIDLPSLLRSQSSSTSTDGTEQRLIVRECGWRTCKHLRGCRTASARDCWAGCGLWVFGMKHYFKALSQVAQQDARASSNLKNERICLPAPTLGEWNLLTRIIKSWSLESGSGKMGKKV